MRRIAAVLLVPLVAAPALLGSACDGEIVFPGELSAGDSGADGSALDATANDAAAEIVATGEAGPPGEAAADASDAADAADASDARRTGCTDDTQCFLSTL